MVDKSHKRAATDPRERVAGASAAQRLRCRFAAKVCWLPTRYRAWREEPSATCKVQSTLRSFITADRCVGVSGLGGVAIILDKDGRRVFSDQAPPPTLLADIIVEET
jgi:hypothetical protein